jgi:arylsulfatase A
MNADKRRSCNIRVLFRDVFETPRRQVRQGIAKIIYFFLARHGALGDLASDVLVEATAALGVSYFRCGLAAWAALGLLASGSPSAGVPEAGRKEPPRKPNIVLILADDLGAESVGCYGGHVKTPNLDALARAGVRFENCYATPYCVPSRMQFMTGRYPFRTGWTQNVWGARWRFDPKAETSFAHVLKSAGYATCVVDKWMLCYDFKDTPDNLREAGFDEHYMWRLWRDGKVTRGYWDAELWKDGRALEDGKGKYGPDLFCDYLIEFMERHADRPFLAYWPMHIPHLETATGRNAPATPDTIGSAGPGGRDGVGIDIQKGMGDMIAYMDALVGRVVAALDRLGIRDRTLILFTGDNGTTAGIRTRVGDRVVVGGKGKLDEAGCRVPLIANWKGRTPAGAALDDLVDFTDFLPTLADAAGAPLPIGKVIDGRSFLPQIRGEPGRPREWVYCQLGANWFIRDLRWRLTGKDDLEDLTDRYAPRPAGEGPEAAAARDRLQAAARRLRDGR